jgi:hypothetical protein
MISTPNLVNDYFSHSNGGRLSILERLIRYLRECARRGATYLRFHIATFARRLAVSERSIQYGRQALERAGYVFEKRREGRSTCLYVVFDKEAWERLFSGAVHPAKPTIKGDFSKRNNKKKHGKPALGLVKQGKLRAKAAWMARKQLAAIHYDNCKVVFRFGHGFNFALKALKAGFLAADIVAAYRAALEQRHKDATDAWLNGHGPLTWEPSSTVSLAWDLLQGAQGRFGVQGGTSGAQSYESWLTGCTEREYGAWRDYAVRRAGEDAFLDQDMAVLGPLWEGFKGAALGLSNGRGYA